MTYTFKKDNSSEIILEGIKYAKEMMQKDGLFKETTTFEELADYAGRHVLITEQKIAGN